MRVVAPLAVGTIKATLSDATQTAGINATGATFDAKAGSFPGYGNGYTISSNVAGDAGFTVPLKRLAADMRVVDYQQAKKYSSNEQEDVTKLIELKQHADLNL